MTEPANNSIVIIGGGHAAAQLCAGLVAAGQGARVHLVCEEAELPYQRPPLSKAYLKNPEEALQLHRAQGWYESAGITLHRADPALAIDRAERRVQLRSGTTIGYAQLVLATGAAQPMRSTCARCCMRRASSPCSAVVSSAWRSLRRRVRPARR
jgi:3-phenylpropionate/trans-cinnamate dioxygenase ferredoxin reductase component